MMKAPCSAGLNQAFTALGAAAADSAERVSRLSAASDLQSFFDEAARLSAEVRALRDEADARIAAGVTRVNEILRELQDLNSQAQSLNASSSDTTGAANRQAELLDELATYMDIKTDKQPDGRLFVSTANGVGLLDNSLLQLNYLAAGTGAYGVDYGQITAQVSASGATVDLTPSIQSGEIRGFLDLRDVELPAIADGLAEFAAGAADALNAAHNDSASYPPPAVLEGRMTGLVGTDVLSGTGSSTLALVNADGTLVQSVQITATAGGFTVDGNAAASINDLVTEINTAFGGAVTATFSEGRLSLSAAAPGQGLASVQDSTTPMDLGGRGFSHFFGLNDIIDSARPAFFETAVTGASAHGLAAGGSLGFKVLTPDGRRIQEIDVAVAGTSLADQLTALNDVTTGLGRYGAFGLDGEGQISFTPAAGYASHQVEVIRDSTQRGDTGLSFTQVFGLGDAARMTRSEGLQVPDSLRANPERLSFAKLDIDGATVPGDLVLSEGDNRGGQALFGALDAKRGFADAGGMAGGQATLGEYAARLAGNIGSRAARAERAEAAALSVKSAADLKRSDVEGVNMDEELANMTLYQQAYNASARLIQAAKEMTDTLMNIV
jgi:flagellar hook-associated protein 1 FlgK